jgi:hypothetical protein
VETSSDRSTSIDQDGHIFIHPTFIRFNRHWVQTSAGHSTFIDQDGHTFIHPTFIRFNRHRVETSSDRSTPSRSKRVHHDTFNLSTASTVIGWKHRPTVLLPSIETNTPPYVQSFDGFNRHRVETSSDRSTPADRDGHIFIHPTFIRFNRHRVKTSADRSTPIDQDGHIFIHPTFIRFNRHRVKTSAYRSTSIDRDEYTTIRSIFRRLQPSSGGNIVWPFYFHRSRRVHHHTFNLSTASIVIGWKHRPTVLLPSIKTDTSSSIQRSSASIDIG